MRNKRAFIFSLVFILLIGASFYIMTNKEQVKGIKDKIAKIEQKTGGKVTKQKTDGETKKKTYTAEEVKRFPTYYKGVLLNNEKGEYIGPADPEFEWVDYVSTSRVVPGESDGAGFLKKVEFDDALDDFVLTFVVRDLDDLSVIKTKDVTVRFKKLYITANSIVNPHPGFATLDVIITKENKDQIKKLLIGHRYGLSGSPLVPEAVELMLYEDLKPLTKEQLQQKTLIFK